MHIVMQGTQEPDEETPAGRSKGRGSCDTSSRGLACAWLDVEEPGPRASSALRALATTVLRRDGSTVSENPWLWLPVQAPPNLARPWPAPGDPRYDVPLAGAPVGNKQPRSWDCGRAAGDHGDRGRGDWRRRPPSAPLATPGTQKSAL